MFRRYSRRREHRERKQNRRALCNCFRSIISFIGINNSITSLSADMYASHRTDSLLFTSNCTLYNYCCKLFILQISLSLISARNLIFLKLSPLLKTCFSVTSLHFPCTEENKTGLKIRCLADVLYTPCSLCVLLL